MEQWQYESNRDKELSAILKNHTLGEKRFKNIFLKEIEKFIPDISEYTVWQSSEGIVHNLKHNGQDPTILGTINIESYSGNMLKLYKKLIQNLQGRMLDMYHIHISGYHLYSLEELDRSMIRICVVISNKEIYNIRSKEINDSSTGLVNDLLNDTK